MIGRFQPGRSGNPGGRPRAAHSIQELARKHAPEAIKTLADIAQERRCQALAYLQPLPYLTAPMAKHPRLAPRTPKPLNGPST